jgi:hypothetical protein
MRLSELAIVAEIRSGVPFWNDRLGSKRLKAKTWP